MHFFRRTTEARHEHFSKDVRNVLSLAGEEARMLHQHTITTEHLVLGLLGQPKSSAAQMLGAHGITLNTARQALVARSGAPSTPSPPALDLHSEARQAVTAAVVGARQRHHAVVDTEHLLLALLQEGTSGAAQMLEYLNVPLGQVRAELEQMLNRQAGA